MSNTFGFIDPVKSKRVTNLTFPKRELVEYQELDDLEFESLIGEEFTLDVECYPNYFLILMVHIKTLKAATFELSKIKNFNMNKLYWCLLSFKFYTFNGIKYDMPMVNMVLANFLTDELKKVSNRLIVDNLRINDLYEEFEIKPVECQHVDVIEVCPLNGSLKKYAGRLHAQRMQELPYDPDTELNQTQQNEVRLYCFNDNLNTILIVENLREQLSLRATLSKKYEMDLMSKSDAQIAEAVVVKELKKILGYRPKRPTLPDGYSCQYKDPGFLCFKNPEFAQAFESIKNAKFHLDGGGSPQWPHGLGNKEKNKKGDYVWGIKLKLNGSIYKMGMGGLHSCEKSIAHKSDSEFIYLDRDVASYYPRIKLNQKLFPKHLTEAYLKVYDGLVTARLAAKKMKDNVTADALKIVINGAFGKLGSKYSVIYSPDLMLQVTLTGQLSLLMLIEMLEAEGIHVISANTDGIVSRVPRNNRKLFEGIIATWELMTNFETEETAYQAIYSKDVNNYIAVKYAADEQTKEVCKLKGAYANPWPDKKAQIFRFHVNPTFQVCTEAICAFLLHDTNRGDYIRNCNDVTKFVSVRDVKGGAHLDGEFVGKFVRWYIATGKKKTINYILSGNKVPDTLGARPCMDLPKEFPQDIDFDWYEDRTMSMLVDIGYYQPEVLTGQPTFF